MYINVQLRCIMGKWLHFKRVSYFHQIKHSLDVDGIWWYYTVCFIKVQTELDYGNKLLLT